jgi:hypothetical protein
VPILPVGAEADREGCLTGNSRQHRLGQDDRIGVGVGTYQDAPHRPIAKEIQLTKETAGVVLLTIVLLPSPGVTSRTGLQELLGTLITDETLAAL